MALQKSHSKSEFLALGLTEHLRGRGEASSSLEAAPGQGADTNRGRSFLHVKLMSNHQRLQTLECNPTSDTKTAEHP